MRPLYSLLFALFFLSTLNAQNYLRVSDPDAWGIPITVDPDWHMYRTHGQFDEVTIISSPKGIYTEVEVFATISQGPDANTWTEEFEIVWQFDLPAKAVVHDSWLWVGNDVIKADIIDFWTALETYEDIVDRNQDPSFFYRLSDNRYEIRIYPLFQGESRRIKMSFLVPASWDENYVKSTLLQNMFQGTDHGPEAVAIGTPTDNLWQNPELEIGGDLIQFTDTITVTSGVELHYMEINGSDFLSSGEITLSVDAPLNQNKVFLSTFSEGDDSFYQMAYIPDWAAVNPPATRRNLIMLDYDSSKTDLSKSEFASYLSSNFENHFTEMDYINVAVNTANGISFLNDSWWSFDESTFHENVMILLESQTESDLEVLLNEGFTWASDQGDTDHVYLFAANDDLVYPPVADDVFANLEDAIPDNIPTTIVDYQTENISVIYYDNVEHEGNSYFYNLLNGVNSVLEIKTVRELSESYESVLQQLFPAIAYPTGILDYSTSLESGITYQRYNLNDIDVNEENKGVILQTGKFVGDFPMNINASLVTTNGSFYNISETVTEQEIISGDTLMREMWYGSYLRNLEALASSDEDRLDIISQSIQERVLTGLTAFLALEPSQGGEPCIDCLLNNGDFIWISTDEEIFDESQAELFVSPNPVSDNASIILSYSTDLNPDEWQATVYDLSGRLVKSLDAPAPDTKSLTWTWNLSSETAPGIYICKIESASASINAKIIVVSR
ncbi:MAG: T9SS type A sorting domain-containing protein [Saprospiraceae bacterium]